MKSIISQFSRRVIISWVLLLLFGITTIWLSAQWFGVSTAVELRGTAKERLSLYQGTLIGALEKYRYLPFVLSENEDIKELLTTFRDSKFFATKVSKSLSETNNKAESNVLYIMDNKGNTLASSNWQEETSFVGHNYAFRPYFVDALEGREGRFFAIGTVSGIPGFFMSHPVYDKGSIIGVAVVKVNLAPLQRQWKDGGENVFIADENDVIFLSSRDDWLYKSITPVSPEQMKSIQAVQQYGDSDLEVLKMRTVGIAGDTTTEIDGRKYLITIHNIENTGWKLHYLAPITLITGRQRTVAAIGAAVMVTIFIVVLFIRERRQKVISTRRALEAEKIQFINRKMELEIDERRRTEKELRAAQDGLVQAGKLAALGQMSAAIAHEINQPIAAIKTYIASSKVLLKGDSSQDLNQSLVEISSLTERMGMITGQLKTFARKAPTNLQVVCISKAIDRAITLMQPDLQSKGIKLVNKIPNGSWQISGDEIRLEQVFVNLFRNAVDAMENSEEKILTIKISSDDHSVQVDVTDTGMGIAPDTLEQLYDPFFTTKSNAEGLGLGLSITYGIVKDLDGDIRASNHDDCGAHFALSFPLYSEKKNSNNDFN